MGRWEGCNRLRWGICYMTTTKLRTKHHLDYRLPIVSTRRSNSARSSAGMG